jgi:Trk-type K+ transport system membrane component
LHHYHHRAFYVGVLSIAMIVVGLLALNFPVYLDVYDQFGFQIKCGTGYGANLTQAVEAGGDHAGQCETALMVRRLWTIPLIAFGSILLAVVVFVAATVWGRESMFGEDPAG